MRKLTYGEIVMVVRSATVADDLKGQIAYVRLSPLHAAERWGLWRQFGTLCGAVLSQKGLPFDPATILDSSNEQLLEAYDWFEKMPKKLYDAWVSAAGEDDIPLKNEATSDPNLSAAEKP